MTERIVVIGGDAAGMSAAAQARRISGDAVQIVAFERDTYSSCSACGIPYWVAGDIGEPERLIARSPEAHRHNGIDLRMRTEVDGPPRKVWRLLWLRTASEFTRCQCFIVDFLIHFRWHIPAV